MGTISNSEEETKKIAQEIASELKPGDVLALYGDLGSGKTAFTRHLAKELGVKENIVSPTFVIEKRYCIEKQNTKDDIQTLIHIDCYRVEGKTIDQDYLKEIFGDKDSVVVIEWPERIERYLPKGAKKIKFKYISENKRKIGFND